MRIIRHEKPVPSYWIPYHSDSNILYQEDEPEIEDEWFELNPESLCYLFSEDLCGPKDEAADRVREYLEHPDRYIENMVRRLTGMTPEYWFIKESRYYIADYLTNEIHEHWNNVQRRLKGNSK